jgi:hypothetical protein
MTAAASPGVVGLHGSGQPGHQPANLGDILERVLDKGLVIAGDIRVNLLDIELLTIKLRLMVVSVETARQLGIDWWERDSFLSSGNQQKLEQENDRLRQRLAALDDGHEDRRSIGSSSESDDQTAAVRRASRRE